MKISTLITGTALFLSAFQSNAQAADSTVAAPRPGAVRVLATAAIRDPLDAILKQAEAAIGKPIAVEYGNARGNLRTAILDGRDFEVALLLPDVGDDIEAAGKIVPGRFEIARVPVAFGLRGDVPKPDVSSVHAIKATMLKAKSVKYGPAGAALTTVKKIVSTLDIATQIHDSSAIQTEVPLAAGEYEINIYPMSEIIPNKKLTNLGPVIAQLQIPILIEAAVGKNAGDSKAARALIAFLQGPAIDRGLKEFGMEKGRMGK